MHRLSTLYTLAQRSPLLGVLDHYGIERKKPIGTKLTGTDRLGDIRGGILKLEKHTYIHNWPLRPYSQDYALACHTIYVVFVNFIHVWRNIQFKVDSKREVEVEKFFMAILFTPRAFARNLLRGNRRKNIFHILF